MVDSNSLLSYGSSDSLLAESLQLDFEDNDSIWGDDNNFQISDPEPTLESVLNSDFETESDICPSSAPTPTPSVGGVDDLVTPHTQSARNSILRHVSLNNISTSLTSASVSIRKPREQVIENNIPQERINAGSASSIAVSVGYIACGTSHGHILNFDKSQILKWAYQDKNDQGTVSALAFNEDPNTQNGGSRLLAGFARGLIVMFDTKSGTALRSLFDCVTPNAGVLNLKWTERPALALCSDSGGSVWSLNFTRKFGKRGCVSKCLFSGAKGEVCAIEPLIIEDNSINNHNVTSLEQYSIIALATLSKYFVITVRPRLKVIKFHMLNGPPDSLPLLSWQMVLIQSLDSRKSVFPVLAVARGNNLFFHQIFVSQGRINLLFLRHVALNYDLLALHWLGPRVIGCVDKSEVLHLMTVSSSKEEELLDLAATGLVYGSSQFKGLATGGNVSPALSLAGNYACYNSIISSRFQHIYILGARSVQMITIRNWSERISFLMKNKRWTEAFVLALEEFKIAKKEGKSKKRVQVRNRIIQLFGEFTSSPMLNRDILQIVIRSLIEVNDLGSLWDYIDIGSNLSRSDLNLILTILAEYIEHDYITKVSPSVSKMLVEYWLDLNVDKLEEMLLKLDWTCLDLNQVFRIIKTERLYRALIHLNANALGDYSSILMELIPKIGENGSTDRTLGNYILVYISCCLAGRAYPVGEISPDKVSTVKHDVLRSLTSAHSILNADGELQYPYLRGLLEFDTRETLNVLALAFQEKEFQDEMGYLHKKRIVGILLEIMTRERVVSFCYMYYLRRFSAL